MPNLTTSYIPFDQRDPLHELEMARALLAQARLQKPLNLTLVRGLEREAEWWGLRAERAMRKEQPAFRIIKNHV